MVPRVALWSPGCRHHDGGNVGLPHLVTLGSYIADRNGARVEILDHDYERRIGSDDTESLLSGDWDVVGLSCYSSFDYHVVMTMAKRLRSRFPTACLVVGGYHPSACPEDFCGSDSRFDYVVIGEGEIPLSLTIKSIQDGKPLDSQVLGPLPLSNLDELPPLQWELLERYRALLVHEACQLNINLSRGCPFQCEFCMERGKRTPGWRAYTPKRAVEELHRLAKAFPRSGGVLRITDALFGFDTSWRREVLERLMRNPLPVNKIWAVTRSDLLEVEDVARFHAARFAVGFGIESGDPGMLRVMRKTSDPDRFLDHFAELARESEVCGMPWGTNLIAGHPGETPDSLLQSATWFGELVRSLQKPTGFLCVDPYRYYPGSPVHRNIAEYESRYGTRVLSPKWWLGGNPTEDSMRVDASWELSFERREVLRREFFRPILDDLLRRFSYQGAEQDYFTATLRDEAGSARQLPG